MNKSITMPVWIYWSVCLMVLLLSGLSIYQTNQLWQSNQGDLNHDGKVSLSDLSILAKHYGKKDTK